MGIVKKLQRSDCLFAADMAAEVLILSHLWSLRVGQEVASLAFGHHQEVASARAPLQLGKKLFFHQLF
jgi:hypothetical protein